MSTTKQNQVIAGRVVEFQDRFGPLSNDDAQWVIQNTGEAIELWIDAVRNRVKTTAQTVNTILSEIVSTVALPATTEKFVVKDNFKVDVSNKAKIKISYLSGYFKDHFMDKIEEPFVGSTMYGRKLKKGSVNGPILSELGGKKKSATTLHEIFAMMESYSNGKVGELIDNGNTNIFYVYDITGTLCAVCVYWNGASWFVDARSVDDSRGCLAGSRVFSRNYSVIKTD